MAEKLQSFEESRILNVYEVEPLVVSLRPCKIDEIGTVAWFEGHMRLERLRQQCILEAVNCVDEHVKDVIVVQEKVPILIREAIIIQVWRDKVFNRIFMNKDQKLIHGFVVYMILYHECTALNFLQILFHHRDAIQSMNEEAVDLIDYCASNIVELFHKPPKTTSDVDDNEYEKLLSDQAEIKINLGFASISIIASFGEYLDDIGVSCVSRLYNTHDVPLLMANLLDIAPWRRFNEDKNIYEVFNDGKWMERQTEEICKIEAQCWLALRSFLLHDAAREYYEMTDFRKQQILKLQKYLHERVIDQISPLIDLKRYLSNLTLCNPSKIARKGIIIESIPEIRSELCNKKAPWKKLRERIAEMIFGGNNDEVIEIAKRVSETYEYDKMAHIEATPPVPKRCENCNGIAVKRCSKCHEVWYCGRQCQVKDWPKHKGICSNKSNN